MILTEGPLHPNSKQNKGDILYCLFCVGDIAHLHTCISSLKIIFIDFLMAQTGDNRNGLELASSVQVVYYYSAI